MTQFIVQSGRGYLVEYREGGSLLTTDPVSAQRLDWEQANDYAKKMREGGFAAELVRVVRAPLRRY